MGAFDALEIRNAPGVLLASIERPLGPLEVGDSIAGVWTPEPGQQRVRADGFGIDGGGSPYFDSAGATPGEEAVLWIDPGSGDVWLEEATAA